LVGKNGTGKTTLMKILAGKTLQDTGTRKCADNLTMVYFDQHREQIDPRITLREALSPNGDFVSYRGQNIHVNGWAKKFLFSPDRLVLPVGYLSGGERARINIAKLMLEPADILFLDEPTNDLDIETLEIIEEELSSFQGAVVLITHDRRFMDTLCTSVIGLGGIGEEYFFSDYAQWERAEERVQKKETVTFRETAIPLKKKSDKKLSYKESRELEGMEEAILQVEKKIEETEQALFENNSLALYKTLSDEQLKRDALYARWQELLSFKS
jgi:ABC transport system ATP-binding/permease protein